MLPRFFQCHAGSLPGGSQVRQGGGGVTRVLVVDDEPRICRFVSRALTAHGHTVETSTSGPDALQRASERSFDLVVLDLLMPGVDGFAVLDGLLALDGTHRVLVLSAVGDVDAKVQCLRKGAVDYLAKPFAVAELLARVDARLSELPSPARARYLKVGVVELDLQRRGVGGGGGRKPPSPRGVLPLRALV